MLLVAMAVAGAGELDEGLTWLSEPPSNGTRVYVTTATWDPVGREILDRLARFAGPELALVAVTDEPLDRWPPLLARAGWPQVYVGTGSDGPWFRSGRLGWVVMAVDGDPVWGGSAPVDLLEPMVRALAEGDVRGAQRAAPTIPEPAIGTAETLRRVRAAARDVPTEPGPAWVPTAGALAARLATDPLGRPRDRELAIALVDRVGPVSAALVDARIRALWELGRKDEALAALEAVATPDEAQRETLAKWRADLGRISGPAPWTGIVNDASKVGERTLVIPDTDDWTSERAFLAERIEKRIVSPAEVPAPAERSAPLVLYGTPEQNPLVAELLDHHRIRFDAEGLTIGSTALRVEAPVLVAALPSPWVPGAVVVVYAAGDPAHAHGLNGLFHGPAQLTLGTRRGGKPEVVGQLSLVLDAGGRVERVDAAPGSFSSAEAIDDLHTLDALLRTTWSGFPDADLALRAAGGWKAHSARVEARLAEQDRWSWTDLVAVLVDDFVDPVQDTHFSLSGISVVDGVLAVAQRRLVTNLTPWVTELRSDGQRVTAGPEGLVGQSVDGIEPVPAPGEVVAGVPYLLPTVGPDGSPAFLVGLFAETTPPDLQFAGAALPLHRLGSRLTRREGDWALREDGALPVLAVRTMDSARLDGMTDTAGPLRSRDRVVLDLRGNHGGGDDPAATWVTTFSPGVYRAAGSANLEQGIWSAWRSGSYRGSGEPWSGSLYVLIDRGVASSGETFTLLASQVPGAVLVGESTSGCTENGNVTERGPLPHTGLRFLFGHTRFAWEVVRPVEEGVGVFPDIWLDEADPVAFVAGLPASARP